MSKYFICSISPIMNNIICRDEVNDFKKEKIAVVGYGWAGRSFYKNINKDKFIVDVYDKNNYFLDTTKLKNITLDKNIKLRQFDKHITKFNVDLNNIHNMTIDNIKYDKIILATGSDINDNNISGVKEHCHFLKTFDDYVQLKKAISKLNSTDNIIIIGGGSTGIELASNLSTKFSNITVIDANDILPNYNNITRQYVKNEHKYINFVINEPVKKVEKKDNNYIVHTDKTYNAQIVIYCAGIKINNPKINNNIYKIGDLSPGEKSAQKARQEGIYFAKCIQHNNCSTFNYESEGRLLHMKNEIIYDKNKITQIYPPWTSFFFDWIVDDSFDFNYNHYSEYPKCY
jgi:NADH dehydrogenase FAD-containing subunit